MILALALALAQPAPAPSPAPAAATATRASEEAAIGRALDAVYAVISGPAGQPRDFVRMKTLFTPDARLYAIGVNGAQGGSLDDYIARSGPFLQRVGFIEKELSRRIQIYGGVAQAWSSYHGTSTDGTVNVRGINSFQLARQPDGRWLVHSILWQAESPALPLPRDMEAR